MKELQQDFLRKSKENLQDIKEKLSDGLTEIWRRDAFRALHTIKGTSQIFGFTASGRLAHALENLLAAAQSISFEKFKNLFTEGAELLNESFERKDYKIPPRFIEKIKIYSPENDVKTSFPSAALTEIPEGFYAPLSQTEKTAFDCAAQSGKNLFILEVGFDFARFAGAFKDLREDLNDSGEVIATTSSKKFSGKIGFQILFASASEMQKIKEIADAHSAEIIVLRTEKNFSNDLDGVLSKVAAHGKSLANQLGKKIEFEIIAEEVAVSAEKLKLVFDVLLHLVRNAVDHGFKTSEGKIEIRLKNKNENVCLIVADNGNGVDLEKVKASAVEKKLISGDENLSEQATLDLIFQSELSTAEKLTEISGRGVGLDAVKSEIEALGGKINVKSRAGKGTKFEILLPR